MMDGETVASRDCDPFWVPDFSELLRDSCEDAGISKQSRREFCERCKKVQKLCICSRLKAVVDNKTKITILQHPKETDHPIGSVRIALLGLRNVEVMIVPEVDAAVSYRLRPKVPCSKRSIAGKGGEIIQRAGGVDNLGESYTRREMSAELQDLSLSYRLYKRVCLGDLLLPMNPGENDVQMGYLYIDHQRFYNSLPSDESAPSDVALLYPSDKAVALSPRYGCLDKNLTQTENQKYLSHLIVLDGTWAKAKRMYFENPWLQSLPHYKLPLASPSLYEGVRRQPKPECLSTLESIVYALKVIEPKTQGLGALLEVFDSMVEDHRKCKKERKDIVSEDMMLI
eukprot:c13620_g1_i1 orf=108-1130(+)